MTFDKTKAADYVQSIDLSGTRRGLISQAAVDETGPVFDQAKNQAQVVGSGIFSFAQGVDAGAREAISDSALLAQLAANKRFAFDSQPVEWFKAYFEVLQNVGWTVQESGWNDYAAEGTAVEVNEQIVAVLTTILGPGAAALSIVTSTINALKAMSPNSSWITIFSRETQKAKIARFQIGLVEKGAADDVFVTMVGCLTEAENALTQVLFFKLKGSGAKLKINSAKVSLNRSAVVEIAPAIRTRVRAYMADYVSKIADI
jgi:hypothetical protein